MSRVNHKLVKQRLNEKRSKITDRQFFTSRILAGHFEDMAAVQTKRYKYDRRIHVNLSWQPKERGAANTDNSVIKINAGHRMVTSNRGRLNRYNIVCGLFAHELGHVLYTDFLAGQTYIKALWGYRWYPSAPLLKTADDKVREEDMWSYVKEDPQNINLFTVIAHNIVNILEDGYIENRVLNNFPGVLGQGLELLREQQFKSMMTVTQLKEAEDSGECHIFESIMQLLLSYSKYGELKYGDEPLSDERIQTVFSLIPDIDRGLMSYDHKTRLEAANAIIIRCWDYIKEYIESVKLSLSSESGDPVSALTEKLGSLTGSSEIGTGSTSPVEADPDEENVSWTAEKREMTQSLAESGTCGNLSGSEGKTGPLASGDDDSSSSDVENADAIETANMNNDRQYVTDDEKGRIPYQQTDKVSVPTGGKVERNDNYDPTVNEKAAEDIEKILDKVAEEAACRELENERTRELNDMAQSISYGNIHEGVSVKINRITSVKSEMIEMYEQAAPRLLTISRQLQKSILSQLKETRKGGKQTGLLFGRRLDSHTLHRTDGKIFYKNALPNDVPQLAVGLLVDESGSMSSCQRITYARAAAIILYDFCQSLDIPVMIYGHSTGYDSVELYSYAEFESIDKDDKYRLMDISARRSNRDGAALRFVAEQLSKRPEDVKLLILISDGQPADSGYGGSAAEEDLRGIKREYQRKKLLFLAAAIGDDKQNIERIYGDSFMDISDLSQLPTRLTAAVKRHIRF